MIRWKKIIRGYFEVSSNGVVRRLRPNATSGAGPRGKVGSIITRRVHKRGYPYVTICAPFGKFGRRYGQKKLVHKLVAEAFLGPCPRGCEVNHRGEGKSNPRLSNLYYATHSHNLLHSARYRKSTETKKESK